MFNCCNVEKNKINEKKVMRIKKKCNFENKINLLKLLHQRFCLLNFGGKSFAWWGSHSFFKQDLETSIVLCNATQIAFELLGCCVEAH